VKRSGVLAVVGILLVTGASALRAEDDEEARAGAEGEPLPAFEEHVTVVGRPIVEATKIDNHADYEYRPRYPMPGNNAMTGLNWSF
jgi:hypothetical protein